MRNARYATLAYAALLLFLIAGAFFVVPRLDSGTQFHYSYIVQSGESIFSVAQKFGVPWQEIAQINSLKPPYSLTDGQTLTIPLSSASLYYNVQTGDSLSGIASRFEVNLQSIANANALSSPYSLASGEEIIIPLNGLAPSLTSQANQPLDPTLPNGGLLSHSTFQNLHQGGLAASESASSSSAAAASTNMMISFTAQPTKTSLVWVFWNYAFSLEQVYAHPTSFNTVSPSLFSIDPNSGALIVDGPNDFGSSQKTEASIIDHHFAVTPIVQAINGYNNSPNFDPGLENLLENQQAQALFIKDLVGNATFVSNERMYQINGYNIDFEPDGVIASNDGVPISALLIQFMNNLGKALEAKGMTLSIDVAPWNAMQYGGVFWDLKGLSNSLATDIIDMDYMSNFCVSDASGNCVAQTGFPLTYFDQALMMVNNIAHDKIGLSVESATCDGDGGGGGSNCIAGWDTFYAAQLGVSTLAVWPTPLFLNSANLTTTPYRSITDWYGLFSNFLQK